MERGVKEREFDESIRKGTQEVAFDTHGMTDQCPHGGCICFDECCQCPSFRGHDGFIVFCKAELSPVDKAMVDLKAVLGKGLFPTAIGDVRCVLVRLYEAGVDDGEEDARETVGLWYQPKPW